MHTWDTCPTRDLQKGLEWKIDYYLFSCFKFDGTLHRIEILYAVRLHLICLLEMCDLYYVWYVILDKYEAHATKLSISQATVLNAIVAQIRCSYVVHSEIAMETLFT